MAIVRCPECNSNDLTKRGARMECEYCGHEWMTREKGPVSWKKAVSGGAACPNCNMFPSPVASTRREGNTVIRYHKCVCGASFKSAERVSERQ
jgi:DNA-directed RNA polymerase subunit RPC12/RpoP